MNLVLDAQEARVIACLIEKEITTPDQYPLSLNALVNACNQKTNRDPVVEWDERLVQDTLDRLSAKHLILERSGFGSRVLKYRHRFCNGDHNPRQCTAQELAIICELLLRGPQTPGELRARVQRLAPVAGIDEVEATLARLQTREDGPFVTQLARAPGAREARFRHLFSSAVDGAIEHDMPRDSAERSGHTAPTLAQRVETLEHAVSALQALVATLATAAGSAADARDKAASGTGDA